MLQSKQLPWLLRMQLRRRLRLEQAWQLRQQNRLQLRSLRRSAWSSSRHRCPLEHRRYAQKSLPTLSASAFLITPCQTLQVDEWAPIRLQLAQKEPFVQTPAKLEKFLHWVKERQWPPQMVFPASPSFLGTLDNALSLLGFAPWEIDVVKALLGEPKSPPKL